MFCLITETCNGRHFTTFLAVKFEIIVSLSGILCNKMKSRGIFVVQVNYRSICLKGTPKE